MFNSNYVQWFIQTYLYKIIIKYFNFGKSYCIFLVKNPFSYSFHTQDQWWAWNANIPDSDGKMIQYMANSIAKKYRVVVGNWTLVNTTSLELANQRTELYGHSKLWSNNLYKICCCWIQLMHKTLWEYVFSS